MEAQVCLVVPVVAAVQSDLQRRGTLPRVCGELDVMDDDERVTLQLRGAGVVASGCRLGCSETWWRTRTAGSDRLLPLSASTHVERGRGSAGVGHAESPQLV